MEETFIPTCYSTKYANSTNQERNRIAQWLSARGIPWQQVGYIDPITNQVCIKLERSAADIELPVGGWLVIFMGQIYTFKNDNYYNLAKTGIFG